MKRALRIAALPAFLLAACATPQMSTNGAPAARTDAAAASQYCWKSKLSESGDSYLCNWDGNRKDACRNTYSTPMAKGAVASGPKDAGRCENGEWLVQVTTK
jgi:hypothetical protein